MSKPVTLLSSAERGFLDLEINPRIHAVFIRDTHHAGVTVRKFSRALPLASPEWINRNHQRRLVLTETAVSGFLDYCEKALGYITRQIKEVPKPSTNYSVIAKLLAEVIEDYFHWAWFVFRKFHWLNDHLTTVVTLNKEQDSLFLSVKIPR